VLRSIPHGTCQDVEERAQRWHWDCNQAMHTEYGAIHSLIVTGRHARNLRVRDPDDGQPRLLYIDAYSLALLNGMWIHSGFGVPGTTEECQHAVFLYVLMSAGAAARFQANRNTADINVLDTLAEMVGENSDMTSLAWPTRRTGVCSECQKPNQALHACNATCNFFYCYQCFNLHNTATCQGREQEKPQEAARLLTEAPVAMVYLGTTRQQAYVAAAARYKSMHEFLDKIACREVFVAYWKFKPASEPWKFEVEQMTEVHMEQLRDQDDTRTAKPFVNQQKTNATTLVQNPAQLEASIRTYSSGKDTLPYEHVYVTHQGRIANVPVTTFRLEEAELNHVLNAAVTQVELHNSRHQTADDMPVLQVELSGQASKRDSLKVLPRFVRDQLPDSQSIVIFQKKQSTTSGLHRDAVGVLGIQLAGHGTCAIVLDELCVDNTTGDRATAKWWKKTLMMNSGVLDMSRNHRDGAQKIRVETCMLHEVKVVLVVIELEPGDVYLLAADGSGYTRYHQFKCDQEGSLSVSYNWLCPAKTTGTHEVKRLLCT
jgi:hypothetical protein